MTQSRWWTLVAVLSLSLVVSGSRAGVPDSSKAKTNSSKQKTTTGTMISKTYPVADLIEAIGKDPTGTGNYLTQSIVKTCNPKSWSDKGGSGTIKYMPKSKTLVVRQTATVHKQVSCMLKAMGCTQATVSQEVVPALYSPSPTPATDPEPKTSPAGNAKQYGHFVMDDVNVNAMGVNCTIKSIRFMYRGDGLDNEVAKCALTGGESETKKNELPKSVTDLLEKLNQKDKPSCCATAACQCCTKAGCCAAKCCSKESKCCTKEGKCCCCTKAEEKKTQVSEESNPDDDDNR